jgi:DNA end-binding protein Ku
MMRSMWNGTIAFGLVAIPVKLYLATDSKETEFKQVHEEDGGLIKYDRRCSACNRHVEYAEIAKGLPLASGDVVTITNEMMAALPLPTLRQMEILQFTTANEIDPGMYNGRNYFVGPTQAGARAYRLLAQAMHGKVAIVKIALRREHLAVLSPVDGMLSLRLLHWEADQREAHFPELDGEVHFSVAEVRMAKQLVRSMTGAFKPGEYKDEYAEALTSMVQGAQLEGGKKAQASEAMDLGAALQESLKKRKAG